jgi:hypothetical protein
MKFIEAVQALADGKKVKCEAWPNKDAEYMRMLPCGSLIVKYKGFDEEAGRSIFVWRKFNNWSVVDDKVMLHTLAHGDKFKYKSWTYERLNSSNDGGIYVQKLATNKIEEFSLSTMVTKVS